MKRWTSLGLVIILLATALLSLFPTSSSADNLMSVPFFSQLDKDWSSKPMSPSSTTLGSMGCLVTSISMVLKYYGINTNPEKLNDYLSTHGGYNEEGKLLSWQLPATYSQGKVRFIGRPVFPSGLNASQSQRLKDEIDAGRPVIVKVRTQFRSYWHWVVVRGRKGNKFFINDPIGAQRRNLGYYGNKIYALGIYSGTEAVSPPPSPKLGPVKNVTTVLGIDCSGSMSTNDPNNRRVEAAKIYVDISSSGDKNAITTFAEEASEVNSLTRIENIKTKKSIKEKINSEVKTRFGATNINSVLRLGKKILDSDKDSYPKIFILLSDGRQYGTEDFDKTLIEEFAKNNYRIYPVLLASQIPESLLTPDAIPDIPLLKEMAQKTGGEFFEAPTAENLRQIYQKIAGLTQLKTTLLEESKIMKKGELVEKIVEVPQKTIELNYSTSWLGSIVKTTLIDPQGKEITEKLPQVENIREENYEVYKILYPLPGQWKIIVEGTDLPEEGERVDFYLDAKIDEEPPEIMMINPLAGQYVRSPLMIEVESKDNIETSKVEFYFKRGKIWQKIGEDQKAQDGFRYLWKMKKSGPFELKIVAFDKVGNSASLESRVILDNEGPKISKLKVSLPFLWKVLPPFFWTKEIKISYQTSDSFSPPETQLEIKRKGKLIKILKDSPIYPSLKQKVKLVWKGKDSKGKMVPPGFYQFTIVSKDGLGNQKKMKMNILYLNLPALFEYFWQVFLETIKY